MMHELNKNQMRLIVTAMRFIINRAPEPASDEEKQKQDEIKTIAKEIIDKFFSPAQNQ